MNYAVTTNIPSYRFGDMLPERCAWMATRDDRAYRDMWGRSKPAALVPYLTNVTTTSEAQAAFHQRNRYYDRVRVSVAGIRIVPKILVFSAI